VLLIVIKVMKYHGVGQRLKSTIFFFYRQSENSMSCRPVLELETNKLNNEHFITSIIHTCDSNGCDSNARSKEASASIQRPIMKLGLTLDSSVHHMSGSGVL
jgi:hypothetical protein